MAVTLATPEALVTAVAPERVALAPEAGAVNDTVTPLTGFPDTSFTVAWRVTGKATPSRADCGAPALAVRLAGAAAVLVNWNWADTEPEAVVTTYVPAVMLAVAVTLAIRAEL